MLDAEAFDRGRVRDELHILHGPLQFFGQTADLSVRPMVSNEVREAVHLAGKPVPGRSVYASSLPCHRAPECGVWEGADNDRRDATTNELEPEGELCTSLLESIW